MKIFPAILNKSTRSVSSAALILVGSLFASRFLGLVRDRVLAGKFGASAELDIYFAAFRIPDLIYNVIIGGSISVAFMPVFISYFSKNKEDAWKLAQSFLYITGITIFLICGILFLLMPYVVHFIVPGFDLAHKSLAIKMSRIILLSPLFLGLSSVFSGVLQSFRKFFIYSLAPIFYNFGIIIGALFLTSTRGILGLAWGVVLGAFMHFLIQVPSSISSGFKLIPPKKLFHPALKRILHLMIPRSLGLAAHQINLWVITIIASTLVSGSLTVFNLANNIQYLPIGILGISFASAVFPNLSHNIAENKYKQYLTELSRTLRGVLFLVVPLSVLFFILRAHIVRIVLGTGEFGWEATRLTAAALGAFTLGIFAYTLTPILVRAFYAKEDSKTPLIATFVGSALNIVLSVILIYFIFPKDGLLVALGKLLKVSDLSSIAIIGLPLAFSISGIVSLIVLFTAFFKDARNRIVIKEFLASFIRVGLASLAAGFAAWFSLKAFVLFSGTDTFLKITAQAVLATFSAGVFYLFIVYIFRFEEFKILTQFLRSAFKKSKIFRSGALNVSDDFTHKEY